jgi:hypothetical protein
MPRLYARAARAQTRGEADGKYRPVLIGVLDLAPSGLEQVRSAGDRRLRGLGDWHDVRTRQGTLGRFDAPGDTGAVPLNEYGWVIAPA